MRRTADVIVVGLGAHGSAALYQLKRRGADVIGIDQYMTGHDLGSSHGRTRITRFAIGEGSVYTPLAVRSLAIVREIEELSSHRYKLYQKTGGLLIGNKDGSGSFHDRRDFIGSTITVAKRRRIAHEILSAAAIRSRFSGFNIESTEIGYYEPDAGILFPELCIHAQIEAARLLGACVHTDMYISDVRQKKDCVAIMTSKGVLRAKKCVFAMGAWNPRFLPPEYARHFSVRRQVMHWFAPHPGDTVFVPERFPVFMWERAGLYGFPDLGKGVKVASARLGEATDPYRVDRRISIEEIESIRSDLAHALPRLSGLRLNSSVCLYTKTPDGDFVIDWHPEMSRILVISACSGHGFKHSAAIGELAAKLIGSEKHEYDLSKFTFSRFDSIE